MAKKRVIKLLKHQAEFLRLEAPFKALVAGYGAGKTETMINGVIKGAIANPHGRIGAYAPTYDLVKLVTATRLIAKFEQLKIAYTYNKSDYIIKPQGMGEIIMRSLSNPERIVAFEVEESHVDEIDTLPKAKAENAWRKIVARNRGGPTSVYTTPEGKNFVYEKWGKATSEKYKMIRARTFDNPFLRDNYVDDLRADYPEALVEAYINGEFTNLTSNTVYYSFCPKLNHTPRELQDDDRIIHVGMDFNITNMHAVYGVDDGTTIQVVGEIAGAYDTRDMINLLRKKLGDRRTIIVYPDASGKSRKTSAPTTDIALLKQAFKVKAPEANPPVRDRVNNLLGLLCNGYGQRHFLVNTDKCPVFTEALESQVWNERTGEPDKDGGFDHANDAGGYLAWGLRAAKRRSVSSSGIRIY